MWQLICFKCKRLRGPQLKASNAGQEGRPSLYCQYTRTHTHTHTHTGREGGERERERTRQQEED